MTWLLEDCEWFRVYDLLEAVYRNLSAHQTRLMASSTPFSLSEFSDDLNALFEENGIGWKMENGQILGRGTEAFEVVIREASPALQSVGMQTSSDELHKAIQDLSRTAYDFCLTCLESRFPKRETFIAISDLARSLWLLCLLGLIPVIQNAAMSLAAWRHRILACGGQMCLAGICAYLAWARMVRFRYLSDVTVFRVYLAVGQTAVEPSPGRDLTRTTTESS